MKILAGSLSNLAESFLHPGYISASPHTVFPFAYNGQGEVIELGEAFQLTGESLASTGGADQAAAAAVSTASMGSWPLMLVGALTVVGLLATAYFNRRRIRGEGGRGLRRRMALASAGALAVMGLLYCNQSDPLPAAIPWENVELQQYQNPELATRALLHGVVADAVINVGQPIDSLANIADEVGLPTTQPTEGMTYALQTYGIDGWGRQMSLESLGNGGYRVTSAGADGRLSTGDDLSITVSQADNSSYDHSRAAFFLRREGDAHYVFFHRWTGRYFRYANRETAEALTGSDLFDVWTAESLYENRSEAVRKHCRLQAERLNREPLLLQIPVRS